MFFFVCFGLYIYFFDKRSRREFKISFEIAHIRFDCEKKRIIRIIAPSKGKKGWLVVRDKVRPTRNVISIEIFD